MHIPSGTTKELMIEPFFDALSRAGQGDASYDRERWLYVPGDYQEYRYTLGTRSDRSLICIGINPSTAEPDNLDPTLKSVERIALANGYGGFMMFNVYAQRATDPDDMEWECNRELHEQNLIAFDHVLETYGGQRPAIWAAWGTIIEKRPYLYSCVADMIRIGERHGAIWYTAGKRSKAGHPHHPLYLRKDAALEEFDILAYTASFLSVVS